MINKRLWKLTLGLIVLLSALSTVVIVIARLPNREVCLSIVRDSQTRETGVFDLTTDKVWLSTTLPHFANGSGSPDNKHWLSVRVRPKMQSQIVIETAGDASSAPANQTILLQAAFADSEHMFEKPGQLVWSGDSQHVAFLWDAQNGQRYLTTTRIDSTEQRTVELTQDGTFIDQLATWSADAQYLLVTQPPLVSGQPQYAYRVWSVADGQFVNGNAQFQRGGWSLQGHIFAGIRDAQLILWTPERETAIPLTLTQNQGVERVVWSPNGHYVTVQSFRPCAANESCAMRRVYDIFSADGKLLVANLTGGDWELASTQRPAEAWLANSQTWLFAQLQPDISVPTATDALIALHLDPITNMPTYQTLATHLVNAYVDNLFYTNWYSQAASDEYAPDASQVLFVTRDTSADPFGVTLMDTASYKSTVLVQNATVIVGSSFFGGQLWSSDGRYLLFGWASRTPSRTLEQHLSWSLRDGSQYHDLSAAFSDIQEPHFVSAYDASQTHWLGFIGVQNTQRAFYVVDLATGSYHSLVDNVDPNTTFWYAFQAPAALQMQLILYSSNQQGSLYFIDTKTLTSHLIGTQMSSWINWSSDVSRFAFIYESKQHEQRLAVVNPSGQMLGDYKLKASRNALRFQLQGWSHCGVP